MIVIPAICDPSEINPNLKKEVLEIPKRLMANSSGKGEAIVMAPSTGSVQAK